jgi:hypothetical protein
VVGVVAAGVAGSAVRAAVVLRGRRVVVAAAVAAGASEHDVDLRFE